MASFSNQQWHANHPPGTTLLLSPAPRTILLQLQILHVSGFNAHANRFVTILYTNIVKPAAIRLTRRVFAAKNSWKYVWGQDSVISSHRLPSWLEPGTHLPNLLLPRSLRHSTRCPGPNYCKSAPVSKSTGYKYVIGDHQKLTSYFQVILLCWLSFLEHPVYLQLLREP